MKNQWYKESVFYQIYPRSFKDSNSDGIGDINGIISKIDYLASLGIDAIWFSPLYASPNADYGYDISDYTSINPEYGTMSDFERMVQRLHDKGIKVIMDLVINHTSDKHMWFQESRSSTNNPYRNYYYWRDGRGKNGKKPPNNWTSFFLGSAWKYDEKTKQWYLHLFDQNQPDLNYFNPKVMQEIQNVLHFWLKKGVDGFRCDVITLLSKRAGLPNGKRKLTLTGSEHYMDGDKMEELLSQLQQVLRQYDAFTVGESPFITVEKALRYTDESNELLTTVFDFDHVAADNHFGVKQLVKKFNLRQLKRSIEHWQHGLYGKSWNTLYFENHDQARVVGRYVSDNVHREEGAKLIATLLMTLSGTPFIYQGQEIGTTSPKMTNLSDYRDVETYRSYKLMKKVLGHKKAIKNLAYCSRDNARVPMQWDDGKNAGFSDAEETWLKVNPNYKQINVQEAEKESDSVLHYYRKLINLRKSDKAFIYGKYDDLMPKHKKIMCYLRTSEYGSLVVVLNFSEKNTKFRVPKCIIRRTSSIVTSNYKDSPKILSETTLRPYESIVYRL
ncbi:MAG: alpha-glucosidase [Corallococcus sp.]|nr:alpha-glucosidase [Corallococcus sp.]MCM1359242.1 alpha-glucosidase [Corallococcus sp.]MCM1394633.1 alpha-glucosidase [Corallococcus sp.]